MEKKQMTDETNLAIELVDVTKYFGGISNATCAVDHLSLSVPVGSIFGLLGSNGAGKTTIIRMLVSHLKPSSGSVRIFGVDPASGDENLRKRVAYISENMQLPGWMTIPEASKMAQQLYPNWEKERAKLLAERFGLDNKKRYDEFSKGQRRTFCLLLALSQGADLLILDEPASGLDTVARRDFLSCSLEFVAEKPNKTILFSSHVLGDIERVVDQVILMKKGTIRLAGRLDDLKEEIKRNLEDIFVETMKK
ncbi:MAG: ABC transporter ATP-binding protein [Thermoguttaceae bacterium]